MSKYQKINTQQFKKENPDLYKKIMDLYAPVFDAWVAIAMYLAGDPPPTCRVCGDRVTVYKSGVDVHRKCRHDDSRYTFVEANDKIKDLCDPWEGKISSLEKVSRLCSIHGQYKQELRSALRGHGCQKCEHDSRAGRLINPRDRWLSDFMLVHGNRYSYHKAPDVIQSGVKIPIVCSVHGEFMQCPTVHKNGHGCKKCAFETNNTRSTTEEFIIKAKVKHEGKYDYSKTVYTTAKEHVTITCPIHGDFSQVPNYHLSGNGCQKCGFELTASVFSSKEETQIQEFLRDNDIEFIKNDRSFGVEVDILIPSHSIGIEMNGLYWHSESVGKKSDYHLNKTKVLEKNGYKLIHIWDCDWNNKRDIVKSRLLSKLGLSKVVYARKCKIVQLDAPECAKFMIKNHIQGRCYSPVRYGLLYEGEIVASMTFSKPRFRKNIEWELVRYCSSLGINVVGGASKLFSQFKKEYSGSVISYSDIMWNSGGLYEKLGFDYGGSSKPSFYYTNDYVTLHNRTKFQKHKLSGVLVDFNPLLSEADNMKNNKYDRVWDCGSDIWIKKDVNDGN